LLPSPSVRPDPGAPTAGRFQDDQNRTLNYLRFIDVDRMLYNFRADHRLSTNGAGTNGGWDAPDLPARTC
jgi:hypothetical protein